jgi:carbonic anhydrase
VYGVSDGLIRELGMAVASNEQLHEQLERAYQQYSVDAYGRR